MKKHTLRTLFILLLLSTFFNAQAQDRENYNLLWQIEGNGLAQSSYLFGTMHVQDARAFNFSDSVMRSIEKCDVFAMELHPDSLLGGLFAEEAEQDSSKSMEELLGAEDYERLKKRFLEINGYEFEDVKSKNPRLIKSLLVSDDAKDDDKQTFVDAYLYGIAKTLGKEIAGLEAVEDQMSLFSGHSEDAQREMILDILDGKDAMVKIYTNVLVEAYSKGNLDLIASLFGEYNLVDESMIRRNKVMAKSVQDLMTTHRVFAAVGAAHLLGDEGVIGLLRAEGYTVTAVDASFTGVADNYKIDVLKMKWPTYKDEEMGFSIDMPGKPFPVASYEELNMQMYPDLRTGVFFVVYTIDLRNSAEQLDEDAVVKKIFKNYKRSGGVEILKKKRISKKGFTAMEVLFKNASGIYSKLHILSRNNIVYGLGVGGSLAQLKEPYIDRFFDSYKSFNLPALKSPDWTLFEDKRGAFSVLLPKQPTETITETPNPLDPNSESYKMHLYMAMDRPTMTNYLIAYNDFPLGYYLENKAVSFEELVNNLKTKGTLLAAPDTIWLDGVEGREFDVILQDKYYTRIRLYIRGNRVYKVIKQNLVVGEKKLAEDDFFTSFSFAAYQKPELQSFQPEMENFELQQFSRAFVEGDSSIDHTTYINKNKSYSTSNPESGGVYAFESYELDGYLKIQHLDTFYAAYIKAIVSWPDSVISVDSIDVGGIGGREMLVANKRSGNILKYRFWLDNDRLYFFTAHLSRDELFSDASKAYFDSYKKTAKRAPFDVYASKTKEIIEGLMSADTFQYARALGAFDYYEFTKEDLPLLHDAALKTFADDTSAIGARCQLIANIGYLQDEASISKLKAIYHVPNASSAVKSELLLTLLEYYEEEGLVAFLELFLDKPPLDPAYSWKMFNPFKDSLPLAVQHFEQLLPLLDNENYKADVLSLAIRLLRSDSMPYMRVVENAFDKLTQTALDDVEVLREKLKEDKNAYQRGLNQYLVLMYRIKGQKLSDEFTKQILKLDMSGYTPMRAMVVRIVNELELDKNQLKSMLASMDTRYAIIEAYDKVNQLKNVPKKYLKQSEIAKVYFRDYLYEDEDYPEEIDLLGKLNVGDSIVYVFKFVYKGEDKNYEYIGLAGGFATNSTKLELDKLKAYTSWAGMKEDWKTEAEKMIPNFKKYGY